MKRTAKWFTVLTMLLAAGCGGGGDGAPGPQGSFACQIDGVAFPAAYSWFAVRNSERVIYATTGDDVRSIWIQFDPPATLPATIPLGTPSHNWGLYTADWRNPATQYSTTSPPPSGTLTITALTDTRCAGTFSFTARNQAGGQVALTNGSFDLSAGPLPQ